MGFNFAGGMAAATGYQQGVDEATARDNAASDRAFLQSQRDVKLAQQQREQQRITADAAIPTTRTQTVDHANPNAPQLDDDGNPSAAALPATTTVTTQVPREEQIRAMADNARKAGATDDWSKLSQAADQLEAQRSAAAFSDLLGSAGSMKTTDLANQAANIWHFTSLPLQISNVRPNGDDGATVDVFNKLTGTTTTRNYDTKDQFVAGLQALADPKTFAALQMEKYKADQKIREEQGKPLIVPAGAKAVNPATGKLVADNNNGMVWNGQYNPDGTPTMVKTSERVGAGGAGGAAANSKSAMLDNVQSILDKVMGKADPQVNLNARSYAAQILGSDEGKGLSPQDVARVAADAAQNPATIKPMVNGRTGAIDKAYVNPEVAGGKPIPVATAALKAQDLKALPDADRERLQAQTVQMAASWSQEFKAAVIAAASDPAKLAALDAKVRANSPGQSEATIKQNIQAAHDKVALAQAFLLKPGSVVGRGVAAIKSAFNGTAPAAADPAAAAAPVAPAIATPGGLSQAASFKPAPVGSAIPAEAAQRAAQAESEASAAAARREANRQAEIAASSAADAKARSEVNGLTEAVIRQLSRQQAHDILSKYDRILSAGQRQLLQQRSVPSLVAR